MTVRPLLLLLVASALLWFLPLNVPALLHPDEGRYGEIPREMLVSGDWVTPRLDAIKYFEKPPLQYWATAAAFALVGPQTWAVRLWPALCAFGGVLLTGWLGRRLFDARTGLFAAAIQAGSLLYAGLGHLAVLDMGLSFTLQLALTALVLLVDSPAAGAPESALRRRWPAAVLLGVGVALATLAKGLVGILIPAAVAFIYLVLYRDWKLLWRSQPWWTLLALALIAAPWFVLVSVRNPGFAYFFFWHEHFARYLTREAQRYQPLWFFVPVLAAGFLPWLGLLPGALAQGWRAARGGHRASAVLLLWTGFIFMFFSVSDSKLIPYIVPLFPALALLAGRTLAQWPAQRFARQAGIMALAALLLAAAVLVTWWLPPAADLIAHATPQLFIGLLAALLVFAACAGVAALTSRRDRLDYGVVTLALGGLALSQICLVTAGQLPQMLAITQLRDAAAPLLGPDTHFYCVGTYPQPLTFYLQRTCTLVSYRGELDFGLQQEPRRGVPDLGSFDTRWRAQRDAFAVISPAAFEQLAALGTPMHVIYSSPALIGVIRQ